MFYIKRLNKEFGPYSSQQIINAVRDGKILKKDIIRYDQTNEYITIKEFLNFNNLSVNQETERNGLVPGNIIKLTTVIFGFPHLLSGQWKENRIILFLLGIVLIPVISILISGFPTLSYILFGLYFASIWCFILYFTIGTEQTSISISVALFAGTALASALILSLLSLSPLWTLIDKQLLSDLFYKRFAAMFFGVGLIEEFCKVLGVYIIIIASKGVIHTRTAVYYGMISGIAFGIAEGIEYQLGYNRTLDADENYLLNLLRLTSLPFFHAIWAGISSFFAAFSFIHVKMRYSSRIVGLIIPALLHSTYNIFGFSLIGIGIIIISAMILIVYLTKGESIYKKLKREIV